MRRREFLAATLAGIARAAARPRPNIVFILADDLGWADTQPYGADLHETPNLNRLAASAVRFTNAYAAAPVCSPTRASIQTGKHPARLGMTIWREAARKPPANRKLIPPLVEENLPHSETTVAEALRAAGYFTVHIGKWHLGDAEHYAQTHGYDVDIGGTVWGAPATYFWPYSGDRAFSGEYRYVPGLHGGKPGEYLTDRFTSEAIRQIEQANGRPFFLHLAYHTVHTPIEGKPELVERYRAKVRPGMHHRNPGFAAMVHSLDENVGRILRRLEELKLAENTIVVFTSDNGGFVNPYQGAQVTDNYPLRSGKGSLYEGGVRIPLLVRAPGVSKPGSVCNEPVCSIDFYRTLLELAGVEGDPAQNRAMDGISFAALLRDPAARLPREELFFHYPHYYQTTTPVSAIRTRDWKLLEYFEDGHVELYDLAHDPSEAKDLAAEMPDRTRQMRSRLEAWRREVKAPLPKRNPA